MQVEPVHISRQNQAPQAVSLPLAPVAGEQEKKGTVQRSLSRPDLSRLRELTSELEKNLYMTHDVDLRFSVHEASGQVMVTVIDESTGKVIREIPPSQILNLAAKFDEMVGLIFDQKG